MNDSPPPTSLCPACGQQAPIVYQGVVPHCTACGAIRPPLSSASVNFAGKSSRWGSTFVSVLGWLVLVVGSSTTLSVVLLLVALSWPMGALAIGLPMALATLAIGVALVRAGRSLAASARQSERAVRLQALLAMTSHRGAVTARDAAVSLGIGVAEADAMLTAMAKSDPDHVAVDVDDQGNVWYRAAAEPFARVAQDQPDRRVRVGGGVPATDDADASLSDETKQSSEEHETKS